MAISRKLDEIEIRILGSLMEKQQSTPDYYPLTLTSLLAACNQQTNREPVSSYIEEELNSALERLQDEHLAWRILGGRAPRWDHNLDKQLTLDAPSKALLTLLFLRGPQTPGEMRTRSERLHHFDSLEQVEGQLRKMAGTEDPLVTELPRRPGQKESRWAHLLGEVSLGHTAGTVSATVQGDPLSVRVERLEQSLDAITQELSELKLKLGE